MVEKFDYIIAGGGASGLSLAYMMCHPAFQEKKILILEKEVKDANDHTWCFWDTDSSVYDPILSNEFSHIHFHSKKESHHLSISPYTYKMLQGKPFYQMMDRELARHAHINRINASIEKMEESPDFVKVSTNQGEYIGQQVFQSYIDYTIDEEQYLYVSQHFKGWIIETDNSTFDPGTATFMDFRIDQYGECRFFYILPLSENRALIEIAIFSNKIMDENDYDSFISAYIDTYTPIGPYRIVEKEYGVIPMTDYPFWNHNTDRIFHIGGAGGAIKASSGFAFKRIQEHNKAIIEVLMRKESLGQLNSFFQNRFYKYDRTLLDVMLIQHYPSEDIFAGLFKNNPVSQIFKFLDGKTSLREEANIFRKMPIFPFLKGFIRQF